MRTSVMLLVAATLSGAAFADRYGEDETALEKDINISTAISKCESSYALPENKDRLYDHDRKRLAKLSSLHYERLSKIYSKSDIEKMKKSNEGRIPIYMFSADQSDVVEACRVYVEKTIKSLGGK